MNNNKILKIYLFGSILPRLRNQTVAVYLRSLRIRAAEEKNIPRPSRELMNCK